MDSAELDSDMELFRYRPDTRGTIRAMGIDQYPGEMPIVRELIQNADDAEATYLEIHQNPDEIIIIHNGKPFTKPNEVERIIDSDFVRISRIGLGKSDEETTGRFGIGFTSVFHISDHPRIISNGWDFIINVDDLPTHREVPFSPETRIHLPYRKNPTELSESIGAEPFSETKIQSFKSLLPNELYQNIFFLKNITRLSTFQNEKPQVKIITKKIHRTRDGDYIINDVLIEKNYFKNGEKSKTSESWKYFSYTNIEIPPYLQSLGRTNTQKVEIALPISRNWKRISRISSHNFYTYYTLPVHQSDFNFNSNSSMFYTTSGRSDFVMKEDTKTNWNKWQSEKLASLCIYCIQYLITQNLSPKIIYHFFPKLEIKNNPIDKYIIDDFNNKITSLGLSFFFTSGLSWQSHNNTVMNWKGLSNLIDREPYQYFIHEGLKQFSKIFSNFGIEIVGVDYLIQYLLETYGDERNENQSEDPKKIRKIYEFLGSSKLNSDQISRLRSINIILSEKNILRNYHYGIYLPTDDEMPLIHPGDIVKKETYQSRTSLKFFKYKLKIKPINLHSLIKDSFIPRLKNYQESQIDDFVWYLIKNQNKIFRKKGITTLLSSNIFDFIKIEKNIDNTDIFYTSKSIKEAFGKNINYLSPYYPKEGTKQKVNWKRFFDKLGVQSIPKAPHVITVFNYLESLSLEENYSKKLEAILRFIENNWKRVYSKQVRILNQLRKIKWVPTNQKKKDIPENVYADRSLAKIVGLKHPFCSIKLPNKPKIISTLGLKTEPEIDHVIENLISLTNQKLIPSWHIYRLLDKKASNLATYQTYKLKNNPILYFKKQVWLPREVYISDQRSLFGSNGWLRVYLKKNRLSKLDNLCRVLEIKPSADSSEDFIYWLIDYSNEYSENEIPTRHRKIIENIYNHISKKYPIISEYNLDKLKNVPILLSDNNHLVLPSNAFLIRENDKKIYERLEQAGFELETIISENVELDSFFRNIGVRDILPTIYSTIYDEKSQTPNERYTKRIQEMLPWLDGFEYRTLGSVSEHNLVFKNAAVIVHPEIKVEYHLDDIEIKSNPISDVCCVDYNDRLIIRLAGNFSLRVVDHVNLLTILLIRHLNPEIEYNQWSLIIPTLLNTKQLFGVSPYYRDNIIDEPEEPPSTSITTSRPRQRTRRAQPIKEDETQEEEFTEWEPDTEPTDSVEIEDPQFPIPWDPNIEPFDATEIEEYVPETTQTTPSTNYGEYSSSSPSENNGNVDSLSARDKTRVGNWGELFAFNAVKERVRKEFPEVDVTKSENCYHLTEKNVLIVKIEWLNMESDKKQPYDIHVQTEDSEMFFEVKSTITDKKDWFKVSKNQWDFAREKTTNYSILRVYKVGTSDAKIIEYLDPYRLWQENKIYARATEILV